jgi:hypothetical protein
MEPYQRLSSQQWLPSLTELRWRVGFPSAELDERCDECQSVDSSTFPIRTDSTVVSVLRSRSAGSSSIGRHWRISGTCTRVPQTARPRRRVASVRLFPGEAPGQP